MTGRCQHHLIIYLYTCFIFATTENNFWQEMIVLFWKQQKKFGLLIFFARISETKKEKATTKI